MMKTQTSLHFIEIDTNLKCRILGGLVVGNGPGRRSVLSITLVLFGVSIKC